MYYIFSWTFENVVCKMSAILFRPQWINSSQDRVDITCDDLKDISSRTTSDCWQLSFKQCVGLCVISWRLSYFHLIIIINSEIWIISRCLGLGHETMACAVCHIIFASSFGLDNIFHQAIFYTNSDRIQYLAHICAPGTRRDQTW